MTGFGEARGQGAGFAVAVEVRAVNNRYLKVTVRGSDPYPMLEPELEKVVRRHVKRGTLHVNVRAERQPKPSELRLNLPALQTYLHQVRAACQEVGWPDSAARPSTWTILASSCRPSRLRSSAAGSSP